ncbi:MAG: HAMP domain-containing histidine kinase [Campylobacteraceae bacterium]|nr:HAMP domain-containing histidine kinase [Campylobacteraceae bacterium]
MQGVKIVKSLFKLSGIELELNLNSAPALYGQQNGLAQVILSLLQNSIRIHKSNESLNPWIKIDLKSNDEEVIISVLDNGGGVKQKPLESIFKPFLSDKKSPSTGLGLYMSRLVIEEKFHGTVNVENIEDGACFTITIPIKLSDNQAY